MKKALSIILAVAMLAGLCACGSSASTSTASATTTEATQAPAAESSTSTAAEPAATEAPVDDTVYTLKWATTETESTIRYQYLEKPVMDLITEKTNGRIQWQVFYSSTLAGSGAIIKGCQDGICDAGGDNINSYPGVFPYTELMTTPGVALGNSYEDKWNNIASYYEAYGFEEAESNGVFALFTAPALDVVLMSNFEVTSTDSYKSKVVCCNGSYASMFTDYGAANTWVVPPEQYESFKLNVIDASVNGAGPLSAFNLYEVLDYAYYIPFATVISSYYLSMSQFNSLPEDLQQILRDLQMSDEFLEINQGYVDKMMSDVMTACTEGNANFQFLDLPEDVAAAMQSSCAAQIEAKVAEMDGNGLSGTDAYALLQSFTE